MNSLHDSPQDSQVNNLSKRERYLLQRISGGHPVRLVVDDLDLLTDLRQLGLIERDTSPRLFSYQITAAGRQALGEG